MSTNASARFGYTAPILVLGLGDTPAGDDGLGPVLLDELAKQYRYAGGFVEFVNGGTKGLDLLGQIAGRQAIVVLDALATGSKPGTVSVLEGSEVLRYATGDSVAVHPGDAHELLATAAFLGDLPEHFYVVGMQPGDLLIRERFCRVLCRNRCSLPSRRLRKSSMVGWWNWPNRCKPEAAKNSDVGSRFEGRRISAAPQVQQNQRLSRWGCCGCRKDFFRSL